MIRFFNAGSPSQEAMRMKALFIRTWELIPRNVRDRMQVINITIDPRIGVADSVADIAATHDPPSIDAYLPSEKELKRYTRRPNYMIPHVIHLHTSILSKLSDSAVMYVIAHELGHGWLDEIGLPHLDSNERDADSFARKWGFGKGLRDFEREAKYLRAHHMIQGT